MPDIFPHPHETSSAEEPFVVDDNDLDAEVGAAAAGSFARGRGTARRTGILLISGAFGVLGLVLLLSSGSGGDGASTALATPLDVAIADAPLPAADLTFETLGEAAIESLPEGGTYMNMDEFRTVEFIDPRAPQASPPSLAAQTDDIDQGSALAGPGAGRVNAPPTFGGIADDYEAQARVDAAREAAAMREAAAQARAEARAKAEEALRVPTLIASGQVEGGSANAGASRFGSSEVRAGSGEAAGEAGSNAYGILPGTRVSAVTTTEYISDAQGGGRIEARLTSPLRVDGRTVLPAGTRAFGSITGGDIAPGREARATVAFDVFLTPSGEVIRDLQGVAGDPQTLAMSVPVKVDRRTPERLVRAAAATAADLMISSFGSTQRASVFEQPSAKELAIKDARERATGVILGGMGDEESVQPAVRLPQGTALIIMFGF
jgi:hypothetical protein